MEMIDVSPIIDKYKDPKLYSFDVCRTCFKKGGHYVKSSIFDNKMYAEMSIHGKFWYPACPHWNFRRDGGRKYGIMDTCPCKLEHVVGKRKFVLTNTLDVELLKQDILNSEAIIFRDKTGWKIWLVFDKDKFYKFFAPKYFFRVGIGFLDDDMAKRYEQEFMYKYTEEQAMQSIILISMDRFYSLENTIKILNKKKFYKEKT